LNATSRTALPLDTWSHLAATFDGSKLKLFVNGIQVAERRAVGSVIQTNSPLRMGANSVWGEHFDGTMDEIQLFNATLTAAEIGLLAAPSSQITARANAHAAPLEFASYGVGARWSAGESVAVTSELLMDATTGPNSTDYPAIIDQVFSGNLDMDLDGLSLLRNQAADADDLYSQLALETNLLARLYGRCVNPAHR
jgi:hypothetical protein